MLGQEVDERWRDVGNRDAVHLQMECTSTCWPTHVARPAGGAQNNAAPHGRRHSSGAKRFTLRILRNSAGSNLGIVTSLQPSMSDLHVERQCVQVHWAVCVTCQWWAPRLPPAVCRASACVHLRAAHEVPGGTAGSKVGQAGEARAREGKERGSSKLTDSSARPGLPTQTRRGMQGGRGGRMGETRSTSLALSQA